jgi:hypothetical protein
MDTIVQMVQDLRATVAVVDVAFQVCEGKVYGQSVKTRPVITLLIR